MNRRGFTGIFSGVFMAAALLSGIGSAARAADAVDPNAVLDKAIKALGGQDKLSAIKAESWSTTGTISFQGNDNDVSTKSIVQGLDHARLEFTGSFNGNDFKAVTLLSGDKGSRDFGGNQMDLDKDGVADQKRMVYLEVIPITILPLKDKAFKVEAADATTVAGKPAVGLKVTPPDGKVFHIYFDQDSGLPVKVVATVAGFMGGEFTEETTFSNYKEMAGIQKATKIVSTRDGQKFIDQQVTDFKILDKVDPKTFDTE